MERTRIASDNRPPAMGNADLSFIVDLGPMDDLPIKKSAGDVAREVGRAAVSLVPAVGGPLQVAFENLFSPPLERRKDAWLQQLAGVVKEVEDRVAELTPEKLRENEAFVTVVMQASQIALRSHQQAKLEALRNAVLNAALPNPPGEDEQMIFLRLIDQLTPWHLSLLSLLDNPVQWMERNGVPNPGWGVGGPSTVLEHCLPDLRGQRDTYARARPVSPHNNDQWRHGGVAHDGPGQAFHQVHHGTMTPPRTRSNRLIDTDVQSPGLARLLSADHFRRQVVTGTGFAQVLAQSHHF